MSDDVASTGPLDAGPPLLRVVKGDPSPEELAAADDPDARRAELIAEYEDTLANPYIAADRGYVDAVIPPSHTRIQVTKALRVLANKRETRPAKKHGNIPL